jgi:hypothetical protein
VTDDRIEPATPAFFRLGFEAASFSLISSKLPLIDERLCGKDQARLSRQAIEFKWWPGTKLNRRRQHFQGWLQPKVIH